MAFESEVCPSCGNLRSVCSDPSIDWHPRTTVCYWAAAVEWGRRQYEKKYGNEKTALGATPLDGIGIYATDQAPPLGEDEFA